MSTHNRYYIDSESSLDLAPEVLRKEGPQISVTISAPDILAEALRINGIQPECCSGYALIDTGASSSVVEESLLPKLHVRSRGKKEVISLGVQGEMMDIYPVKISFPKSSLPDLDFNSVIASPHLLKEQGIIALIGRDILQLAVFVYHGNGHFTLALDPDQTIERGRIAVPDSVEKRKPTGEIRGGNIEHPTMDW